jgi:predicted O-methyltransferase YrrM
VTLAPLLFLAIINAGEPGAPSAEELLARHLQAIGGREAAGAVFSLVRKGTYSFGNGSATFPAELYARAPNQWRFVMTIPGTYFLEHVSDGKAGWVQSPDGTAPMPPEQRPQEDCAFNLSAVLRPQEYLSSMTVKGREKAGGREVWVVEAKPPEGKPVTAHFDVETGLLTALGDAIFEDYRPAGDIQAPYTIRLRDEKSEEVFSTSELRPNEPIENSRFEQEANTRAYRESLRRITRDALDETLKGIEAGAARAVLEDLHGFSPSDGRILYDRIVAKGYRRGLEIGTAKGNSAIWMGMAFRKNGGKLITIEINDERAKAATENFRRAGLDQVVECRNNDAFKEIPALEGSFDFVFMDTGTALHKKFLDLLYARVANGGTISSHNANTFARQMPDFLKAITTDPHLETEIIRTPTGGFSFSRKKE